MLPENSSFDGSTLSYGNHSVLGTAQANDLVTESLAHIQGRLQSALSQSDPTEWLANVFVTTDEAITEAFIADVLVDKLVFPQVQLIDGTQIQNGAGKYSVSDNTIYLAAGLAEPDAITGMVETLTEGVGHYIDTLLNSEHDTPGDEGAYFRKLLWGDGSFTKAEAATFTNAVTALSDRNGNDNSLSKARNIGIVNGNTAIIDSVDRSDRNDYYRFTLNNTSDFELTLSGLSANANVQLFNEAGRSIGRSATGGTRDESISKTLDAGDYYARVFAAGRAETSYTLGLSTASTTVPDQAGNTRSKAFNIGTLNDSRAFQDFVGTTDTDDYYRFRLRENSDFSLALTGLSADADVQLLDRRGQLIESSELTNNSDEQINLELSSGSYYVRVLPFLASNTDYTLNLSTGPVGPIDGAGNTRAKALNIGLLDGDRTFQDFVGTTDTDDYYRFRLKEDSDFSLSLTDLSGDADVRLLDRRGQLIESSALSDRTDESIDRQLSSGNYYVQVVPYQTSNTNYTLNLSAALIAPTDGAGNTLGDARNIGTLSNRRTFQDAVGTSTDINDYYRFRLNTDSDFSLALTGLSADADVQLLDNGGQVIQSATFAGNSSESIERLLTAGTYYARVYPYEGSTDYSLSLEASEQVPEDGAGNTRANARNIGLLTSTRTFQDFVGTTDTNDYYRFDLSRSSLFQLSMTGLSSDADVELLDSSGDIIQGSYRERVLSEEIESRLDAGSYYVRVYPYSNSTDYRLSLSAGPNDSAGNSLSDALNIGTLSGTRFFEDAVSSSDTDDYYRFSIARNSQLSLSLTGLSDDIDIQLLNSSGQLLESSTQAGTQSESISTTLRAGTYYARVYPYTTTTNTANSNYQLTLNSTQTNARYSSIYGYGLVNAATAVASALGQLTALPAVADRGGNLWGADLVNAPEAWASGYTGDGVVVAVIDSGVDYLHPDLQSNIWINRDEINGNGIDDDGNGFTDDVIGWDFIGRDNDPDDEENHGTHVAGTIAAANNRFGVTGIAYDADIMAVRVLDSNGSGTSFGVAEGIRYAADNGANVINLSLGSSSGDRTLEAAVRYATQLGAFVVMASGNDFLTQPGFPARYALDYGVSVGAVNRRREDANFSNSAGSNSNLLHVVAPGVEINSTVPNNGYGLLNGTSMATPHVAGVVALMLEANPNLTHNQIRQILADSSTRLA